MKSLTWYICLNSLHFSSIEVFLYTCQLNVKSIHLSKYTNPQWCDKNSIKHTCSGRLVSHAGRCSVEGEYRTQLWMQLAYLHCTRVGQDLTNQKMLHVLLRSKLYTIH